MEHQAASRKFFSSGLAAGLLDDECELGGHSVEIKVSHHSFQNFLLLPVGY